jgi:hypothetical protein
MAQIYATKNGMKFFYTLSIMMAVVWVASAWPCLAQGQVVGCGCYCGKTVTPPCSDEKCRSACAGQEASPSSGGAPSSANQVRNWVYIDTNRDGTGLYYDANGVVINRDNKTFSVEVKYVYSYAGKQDIVRWAKEKKYYTAEYENLSYEIDEYFFDYRSARYEEDAWDLYTDQGKFIDGDESYGDWVTFSADSPQYLIYHKVIRDFNLF